MYLIGRVMSEFSPNWNFHFERKRALLRIITKDLNQLYFNRKKFLKNYNKDNRQKLGHFQFPGMYGYLFKKSCNPTPKFKDKSVQVQRMSHLPNITAQNGKSQN